MWYWPPLQAAYYFCSVLAFPVFLNLSCFSLLSKAAEVAELKEGKNSLWWKKTNCRILAKWVQHKHGSRGGGCEVQARYGRCQGWPLGGEGGRRAEHRASRWLLSCLISHWKEKASGRRWLNSRETLVPVRDKDTKGQVIREQRMVNYVERKLW